jgi:hypothetical protein
MVATAKQVISLIALSHGKAPDSRRTPPNGFSHRSSPFLLGSSSLAFPGCASSEEKKG